MSYPVAKAQVGAENSPRRSRASELTRGTRKVLMIAQAFPSTGGPGVPRLARLAKYLPQFGWYPTVWTADEVDDWPRDPTPGDDLPSEGTACPRNAGSGILAVRRSPRGFVNARAGEGLTAAASRFAKAIAGCLEAECHGWNNSGQSMLDEHPHCSRAVARRSVDLLTRQLRSERFDVIYSTYGPASNHWLALELKRCVSPNARERWGERFFFKNLPWVADFRDLWADDSRYREPSPQRRAAHRQLEQEVFETADVVITVSERQRRILADQMPARRDKFITMTHNRFDSPDFAGLETYDRIELTRQLASVFDRLADRAAEVVETVQESLATCQP